ncbi:MAG: M20/M25/M40 family metallo-hydrolase, partial [Oxalobacteraceae bacterium]
MTTVVTHLDVGVPERAPSAVDGVRLHLIFTALIALVLLALFGLQSTKPPLPAPSSTPDAQFSAERAMVRLRHIASKPHPTGSPANAEVRDYLVGELKALGLDPQVQSALATSALMSTAGNIHNIVVRVPGRVPGKALMLAAHYDSVPTGYGAADDGASVAAILETLRALKTSGRLQNDLIVLLTDGEEAGLLGAEAFVAKHPWARDVGLVLNFEYRGNSGPMLMFETSAGNGKLVEALGSVPRAAGSSLLYEVYKLLPNDTDLSAFRRAGMPAMNFAAMERATSYHTQLDTADNLNQGSMQQQGDIMLALARHFGQADMADLKAGDRVYFELPGVGMVTYPAALALPLALVCVALLGSVLVLGVRSGALRVVRSIVAGVVVPFVGIVIAIVCSLLWGGIKAIHPHYRSLLDVYNGHWYWLGFVALAIVLFVLATALLQRWLRALELAAGTALLWVGLLLLCTRV